MFNLNLCSYIPSELLVVIRLEVKGYEGQGYKSQTLYTTNRTHKLFVQQL